MTVSTPEKPLESTLEPEYEPLALADRCDACRTAQAFVRVVLGGTDLLLCGHHYADHEPVLLAMGWAVYEDARTAVNSRPSISANAL
jgi:hypothetical protein